MIRTYEANTHRPCAQCGSMAPKSWLRTADAVQDGYNFYCSRKCFEISKVRAKEQFAEAFKVQRKALAV